MFHPVRARPKPPSPHELGARLRAARAYRDMDQIPAAKKLSPPPPDRPLSAGTLGKYEKGQIPTSKLSGLVERAPGAFDLPDAFFVIDFNELAEMSEAWTQVKRLARPQDLERLVDQALDEGQQS